MKSKEQLLFICRTTQKCSITQLYREEFLPRCHTCGVNSYIHIHFIYIHTYINIYINENICSVLCAYINIRQYQINFLSIFFLCYCGLNDKSHISALLNLAFINLFTVCTKREREFCFFLLLKKKNR